MDLGQNGAQNALLAVFGDILAYTQNLCKLNFRYKMDGRKLLKLEVSDVCFIVLLIERH